MNQGDIASPFRTASTINTTMPAMAVAETQKGYPPEEASVDTSSPSGAGIGSATGSAETAGPAVPAGATGENRWNSFTAMNAAIVETHVAKSVVGRMPAGSTEPAATRNPMTPLGSNVTAEVLMARNSAIALVAVPLTGFSLSSSCIARMPNGVAALPRPSAFAEKLRIMAPIAG